MDTQNTTLHIRTLRKEFWMLAIANMLVTMAVYMTIPQQINLLQSMRFTAWQQGCVMGVFGLGLFVFGPYINYFVERYPRKRVGLLALLLLIADMGCCYYVGQTPYVADFGVQLALRFLLGVTFGMFQMVLLSTLVIDSVQSFVRTEANHHAVWFGRFAMALGPFAGLWALQHVNVAHVAFLPIAFLPIALSVLAYILVALVGFPFKTPAEQVGFVSFDRFFLPEGSLLFIMLFAVTTIAGMLLTIPMTVSVYGLLLAGFLLALLSERFVFANADLKSEAITGLTSMLAALLISYVRHTELQGLISATLFGLGLGLIGSRFLLFFIKLSRHCQRGTSQSSFFLGWESGISCGLFLGLSVFQGMYHSMLLIAIIWIGLLLAVYNFFVHNWYTKHRNR